MDYPKNNSDHDNCGKRTKTLKKQTEIETEASTSTEEPVKPKTAKAKLPTEETQKTTKTVKEAKERVPSLVLESSYQWKDILAWMNKENVDERRKPADQTQKWKRLREATGTSREGEYRFPHLQQGKKSVKGSE